MVCAVKCGSLKRTLTALLLYPHALITSSRAYEYSNKPLKIDLGLFGQKTSYLLVLLLRQSLS